MVHHHPGQLDQWPGLNLGDDMERRSDASRAAGVPTLTDRPSASAQTRRPDPEGAATQFVRSPDDYLQNGAEIGRAVGNNTREIFVASDAGEALQILFERIHPIHLVIHDVLATKASRKTLAGIAAGQDRSVSQLVIRRQGSGTTLARVEYVCPTGGEGAKDLRLYSSDVDADSVTRYNIARALMRHARLAVLIVGNLPIHAIAEELKLLREHLAQNSNAGNWHCHEMLVMPLANTPGLADLVRDLSADTCIEVTVTPPVTRPADVWPLLSAAWNRHQASNGDSDNKVWLDSVPDESSQHDPIAGPVTRPPVHVGLTPGSLSPPPDPMSQFILTLAARPGVMGCCLFEVSSSRVLASDGGLYTGTDLARRGTLLLSAAMNGRKQLGLNPRLSELVISGDEESNGLRTLGTHHEWAVHVVFNPGETEWAALRPWIQALDTNLLRSPVI